MDSLHSMFSDPEYMRRVSVVANVVSSLIILYMMQAVTAGAGLRCPQAAIRLIHRASLAGLSMALMYHAYDIIEYSRTPTLASALVNGSFTLACVISAVRHSTAPPIPRTNNWHTPIWHRGV